MLRELGEVEELSTLTELKEIWRFFTKFSFFVLRQRTIVYDNCSLTHDSVHDLQRIVG